MRDVWKDDVVEVLQDVLERLVVFRWLAGQACADFIWLHLGQYWERFDVFVVVGDLVYDFAAVVPELVGCHVRGHVCEFVVLLFGQVDFVVCCGTCSMWCNKIVWWLWILLCVVVHWLFSATRFIVGKRCMVVLVLDWCFWWDLNLYWMGFEFVFFISWDIGVFCCQNVIGGQVVFFVWCCGFVVFGFDLRGMYCGCC